MGCGAVAEYGHFPALVSTPGLELAAILDPSPARLQLIGDHFGVANRFTDQNAFLDSGLDAVVVASSAGAHKQNVLGAARRGIDILCEKPLALTDEDAEEMIAATEQAGVLLATGFVYRFSPVALQIKDWIKQGIVGEIRSLRLIYDWDLHGQWEQDANGKWIESPRWRGRMLEGGPMVDCGVHQIDLARWWLGQEVVASTGNGAWVSNYEAPDHVYLHLDHNGGAHTMVEMSFTYGHTAKEPAPMFSYDLIGTGGVIRFDRDGWRLEARTGERTIRGQGASEKNFPGMYAAFAAALETRKMGELANGRDGLVATKLSRDLTEKLIRERKASTSVVA